MGCAGLPDDVHATGTMKRIAFTGALLVIAAAGVIVLSGASSGASDPYQVRAIFDDAAFAVPGEEVRVAGAPVGTIASLGVTDRSGLGSSGSCTHPGRGCKAAVTLEIDTSGFIPFHANAFCAIRPQSLIGEKYVDCSPGTASTRTLHRIATGPGAGTYLLPVTNTRSPVDTDIVQDIYREPVRQELAIVINELGTALAARGSDLNAVIHRANPALGYTDQVFQILARQNRQLAQLATDSATVLSPLARDRRQIAGFVVQANRTSVASAARATDLARSVQLLPEFLRQLRPLMADLGNLADQGTPVMASLNQSAAALARQYTNLAPFAGAARGALIALGSSAVKQQPALLTLIPAQGHCGAGTSPALICSLQDLGRASVPTAKSLDLLTASLDRSGAIKQLMSLLFYGTAAGNGLDSVGHYLRQQVLVGSCTGYAKSPVPGCSSNFARSAAASDVRAARAAARSTAPTRTFTGLLHYLIGPAG